MSGRVGEFAVNFVHDGGDAEGREAVLKASNKWFDGLWIGDV